MQTHYFLAIPLPEEIKSGLHKYAQRAKGDLAFERWVHYEDLHITLTFLGNCSDEKVEKVITSCQTASFEQGNYPLSLNQFGTFGRPSQPRIFWIGVIEQPQLFAQQNKIFSLMKSIGFSLENRPYSPHITLARKWKSEKSFVYDLVPPLDIELRTWIVNSYVLYKTNVTKQPKYEVIARLPLE